MQYKCRKDVPEKYKWDLSDYYKDDEEFNQKIENTSLEINKLSEYKGCTNNPEKLYEYLNLYFETLSNITNLYIYAYMINDQELGISKSLERKTKSEHLYTDFGNNNSFFDSELLQLSEESYNKLFLFRKLEEYKNYLDNIYRKKEHILDEDKEIIVNNLVNAMDTYEGIYSNLKNSEIDYGTITIDGENIDISTTNYRKLIKNRNEEIRKNVYDSFNKGLDKHKQTFSMLLNSYVSMKEKSANIYNYKNSWDAKLFGLNMSNNIFEKLVDAVMNNTKPINRYFELKAKTLNKEKLDMCDFALELVNNDAKYTIEEAQSLILEALKPLGNEYLSKIKEIFDNRYIDYCEYKGKESGGYSIAGYTKPSRILMSYNEDLTSVSIIIHECGHNVNHQYIIENNYLQYRDNPSTITAEVASLTNECLLSHYLMNNGKTKEEKLSGIENIMDVIVSNLYGSVREGKVEQEFHKLVENNDMITPEFLDAETLKYLKKYFGEYVNIDKYVCNNWITRSHYYMNYYLYSYAISISVAIGVSKKIIDGDKEMLRRYLEFLKCGDDKWTNEAFEILGFDLENKKIYEGACDYLDYLIDKYYEILENGEVNE